MLLAKIRTMETVLADLTTLYADSKACARVVGLNYIEQEDAGFYRQRRGKGFSYRDAKGNIVTDKQIKQHIAELVIPPAWQEVWICPSDNGHVLATGIDDKGRKQYIYHPKWRTMRDLIKFYRLLIFANALPKIRQTVEANLGKPAFDRDKVLAVMLWLLDNTYLRIGNEVYFETNESVGLTTLSSKHLIVAGSVSTLSFKAKSGKMQQITFDDTRIAKALSELAKTKQPRLFTYQEKDGHHTVESNDLNAYLHDLTGQSISAKDFRTWGGTLLAFDHLVSTYKLPDEKTPKPDKVATEAIDAAADVLGNTRAVAKSSYVHPHILQAYAERDFAKYYETARSKRARHGLDKRETELVTVLEQLFEHEFTLLKQRDATGSSRQPS